MRGIGVAAVLGLAVAGSPARPQIAESTDDPTGVSIAYPLVHLVHSLDSTLGGSTAELRRNDPYLLYQLGRDLLNRQFTLAQGAYGNAGRLDVPLYVGAADELAHGVPARFARAHASSCGFCHQNPYREPGGGQTIGSTGGAGRNSTHFYGAGLVEMLAQQTQALVFEQYDTNQDGAFDRAELAGPRPVEIMPTPGALPVHLGDLAPGVDGVPQLNPAFRLWYLDKGGHVLPGALSFRDLRVDAFSFAFEPFGWGRGLRWIDGQRVPQGGEAATIREFYTGAADVHLGLQAHDPSQLGKDPAAYGAGGRVRRSLSGAWQYDFGGCVDLGLRQAPTGLSLDDPDDDGVPSELTQGDVDAVEFYMLHAPPPAVKATAGSEIGRVVLDATGCTRCHIENWQLLPWDSARGITGDRRLFHLAVGSARGPHGTFPLSGRLVQLHRPTQGGGVEPRREGFLVERVYTDFKHWDLGDAFAERRFDGTLQRMHRTAPLWGVGSTAPYGHAGQFPDLHSVISAHGGAAEGEGRAYRNLPVTARRQLAEYLKSLVLYATDEIPADIDGDGRVAGEFAVDGQFVGYERFDARFLLRNAPRYRTLATVASHRPAPVTLALITNPGAAFGLDLPARRDDDGDGFPNLIDPIPDRRGVLAHDPP